MSERDGLFVTVEGIDGAGKTTACDAITGNWKRSIRTQEPSDFWTGKQVRKAISNDTDTHPFVTFYLFMADRVHHINERIEPAVDDGMLVVSDRYADSTLAYQPVALNDHVRFPQQYMERVMEPWNYEPDLTIYIDIDVETAMERVAGDEEYEKAEFLQKVKSNYEDLNTRFSDRYVVVDGTQSKEEVREEVVSIIEDRYE